MVFCRTNKQQERKQKERLERDALILQCATDILIKDGWQQLNMQAVAAMTDYSKGTIYQHYRCKEDLLAALVVSCGKRLLGLMEKALNHQCSVRCRIGLMSSAFFLNAEIEQGVSSLVSMVKSQDFLEKVSETRKKELQNIDNDIFRLACMAFYGEQGRNGKMSAQEVMDASFGWWSMLWGLNDVKNQGWDIERLGFSEPMAFFYRGLNIFLDGLGIEQDSEFSHWSDIQTLTQQVFAQEIEQLT